VVQAECGLAADAAHQSCITPTYGLNHALRTPIASARAAKSCEQNWTKCSGQ
jgi:hypothetical protein